MGSEQQAARAPDPMDARREIVSVAGLACLIVLLSLMLAQWMAGHPFD